jgi:hypothetical protein
MLGKSGSLHSVAVTPVTVNSVRPFAAKIKCWVYYAKAAKLNGHPLLFVLLVVSLCDRMFCALVSLCDGMFCALGGVFM